MNNALLSKWEMENADKSLSAWHRIVAAIYKCGGNLDDRFLRTSMRTSSIWRDIRRWMESFSEVVRWNVGDGNSVLF
ncbi:hypothetical protein QJS04_geneDACA016142 [Acorus gramineus]|uniref:Uncharacterized protein n=1 Tax=Acorus gramineus TaxID=55184 RepID=A0AAV9AME6_ACOGR|nr:hypothetical protein QJS04_geneDACA016142 [Acorus gramineus]